MNNLKITILFLLTGCFATAQSTEVLVGEVMTALRQGEYADVKGEYANVNRQTIYNAPVEVVIKTVSPFLSDTAKGAMTLGVKLAIADLFVTFSDPYFSRPIFHEHSSLILKEVFDIEDEKAKEIATVLQITWTVGATGATLSTAKDVVTPKKQIEALATYKALLNKVGDEKEVIRILANDKQLSRQVVDNFKIIENKLRSDPNVSKILDDEIKIATKKIDDIVKNTGNSIADIQNTLLNQLSANSNLRKSIGQLNVNADFNQTLIKKLEDLNVSNGKGGKLIDDFDQIVTEVSNPESLDKLLDAWHILQKGSSQIASIPENSKILAKVADRFAYRGEDAFAGLNKLFNEGSEVASKQKLIDGLKEADQLFDEALKLPIQFSAIKKGEVTVNVASTSDAIKITDGGGEEVARFIDGILQKKKVIPEGDGVKVAKHGNTPEDDILHKGDNVGFRSNEVREIWNGFSNIFKANSNEVIEATNKIKKHRTTTGNLTGGNYGYLDGIINGQAVDNKMWRSGQAIEGEPQIFDAIEVEGSGGQSWLRTTDSEYKMLNKLADDLGGVKGQTYPDVNGTLKIISENPYCASCQGVIQQFNEMYPNIKLILVDGVR